MSKTGDLTDPSRIYRYPAFISYSTADARMGEKLHKMLESYRVPVVFRGRQTPFGPLGKRVSPVFRDSWDLEASSDLQARINRGLLESAFLIVLCSPRSASSKWVNKEIAEFKRQGKGDCIIAALIDGAPVEYHENASPAGAFPPALLRKVNENGELIEERESEPIAADLRNADHLKNDDLKLAVLKIVSAMTGISLTDITQRTQEADRAEQRIRFIYKGVAGALATVVAALAVYLAVRYWNSLGDEGRYLALLSRQEYAKRNSFSAAALALEAVPKNQFDRPAVPEAQEALRIVSWRFPLYRFQHGGQVWSARFNALGTRVVTASSDQTAKVWDTKTGKLVTTLIGHAAAIGTAEFSSDGSKVVTASYDGTARIWNASTGEEIHRLTGHQRDPSGWEGRRVLSASFSPDGGQVLTVGVDGTARLWASDTGRQRLLLRAKGISHARFSPDGKVVAAASHDEQAAILFDSDSGREIRRFSSGGEPASRVYFSFSGKYLAVTDLFKLAYVWVAATGVQQAVLRGHEGSFGINDLEFTPDERRIITVSSDHTGRLWDVASGKQILMIPYDGYVSTVVLTPDGSRALTASQDKTARIWDIQTATEVARLDVHSDIVQMADLSRDGRFIVTASDDKTSILWDIIDDSKLVSELCRRIPVVERTLSSQQRSGFKLSPRVRDPCRSFFLGLNVLR